MLEYLQNTKQFIHTTSSLAQQFYATHAECHTATKRTRNQIPGLYHSRARLFTSDKMDGMSMGDN